MPLSPSSRPPVATLRGVPRRRARAPSLLPALQVFGALRAPPEGRGQGEDAAPAGSCRPSRRRPCLISTPFTTSRATVPRHVPGRGHCAGGLSARFPRLVGVPRRQRAGLALRHRAQLPPHLPGAGTAGAGGTARGPARGSPTRGRSVLLGLPAEGDPELALAPSG